MSGNGQGPPEARLAYLATLYPALSHSFVQREVEALRARGLEIHTFALHSTDPEHVLTIVREEAGATPSQPHLDEATKSFEHVALTDDFVEFLTLPAYELL